MAKHLNNEEILDHQEVEAKSSPDDVLKALLSTEQEVEKKYFMKRFGVDFTIRAIDGKLIDRIQDRATYYEGKGSKRTKKFDEQLFGALVIQHGCITPNWNDQTLKDHYGTHDPVEVIKKRLLAGEIAKLSAEIMDLSGFGDEEDAIEAAKN